VKAWVAKTPAQDSDVTPCGSQVANYDFGRPDFTAARHAGSMTFHGNTAVRTGIAGFAIYAESHRLKVQPIPVHQAHAYTCCVDEPWAVHAAGADEQRHAALHLRITSFPN